VIVNHFAVIGRIPDQFGPSAGEPNTNPNQIANVPLRGEIPKIVHLEQDTNPKSLALPCHWDLLGRRRRPVI